MKSAFDERVEKRHAARSPLVEIQRGWSRRNPVQLGVLSLLKSGLQLDYMFATALAVEAAVLHNYVWHERFTWADRARASSRTRLAKFNLTTGLFSILGNVVLMRALVGGAHLNYFVANVLTIALCSLLNFVVSDRFVFGKQIGPRECSATEVQSP